MLCRDSKGFTSCQGQKIEVLPLKQIWGQLTSLTLEPERHQAVRSWDSHELSENFQEAGDRFSLPNHRKLESHHSCLRKCIENSIDLKDVINSTKNDGLVTVDESRSRDCEVGWSVCESPDQKNVKEPYPQACAPRWKPLSPASEKNALLKGRRHFLGPLYWCNWKTQRMENRWQ